MRSTIFFLLIALTIFSSVLAYGQSEKINSNNFLIVLDVQADYTKDIDPEINSQFIQSVNAIIEKTVPKNVLYVVSVHKALNVSFKSIYVDTIVRADLDTNLTIVNERIYYKEEGDAFSIDELKELLADYNAKNVIVTGLLTEKCVSKTLIGGLKYGFNMTIIPEATHGQSDKSKDKAIKKLMKKGVINVPLSDYLNK